MQKLKLLIVLAFFLAFFNIYLIFREEPYVHPLKENYFIAANYFNSEESLKYTLPELKKLISTLNTHSNVYLSIFENGSTDSTPVLLQQLDRELSIPRSIITCNYSGSDSWEQNNKELSYLSKKLIYNFGDMRFRKMAALRNLPLLPLYTHTFPSEIPTKIIYLNDIFYDTNQILDLVNTNSGEFDMACALDFYYTFYDTLATRDIEGYWFSGYYPFIRHKESQELLKEGKPFEVYSCWNGVAILRGDPFLKNGVEFRQRTYDLDSDEPCECVQSECLLICHDFRKVGFNRIFINPTVKVSYEWKYYMMHTVPFLSWLTYFWQSFSYEFPYDTEGHEATDVGCGMPPNWFKDVPEAYMSVKNHTCALPFSLTDKVNWTASKHQMEHAYTKRYIQKIKGSCLD